MEKGKILSQVIECAMYYKEKVCNKEYKLSYIKDNKTMSIKVVYMVRLIWMI